MPDLRFLAIKQIMQSRGVRKKLDEVADRIAARAEFVAQQDTRRGRPPQVNLSSGTRPGAKSPIGAERPYSRVGFSHATTAQARADVSATLGGSEFGTATTPRTRSVARTISGSRNP